MAGSKKKWDGKLNPGGIIGGLASGVIVGVLVFANADPNNMPRWAYKAPVFAIIGGAFVGTVIWGKCFSKPDPLFAAVTAAHELIVKRGAECPRCKVHHTEYRLTSPSKSLDDPCIVCRSCGRSLAAAELDGISVVDQIAA